MSGREQGEPDETRPPLSALNIRGGYIETHRSIRYLPFPRRRYAVVLLLPVFFNLLMMWTGDYISAGWHALFKFWVEKLELPATVTLTPFSDATGVSHLPSLALPSVLPDTQIWWAMLVLTVLSVPLGRRLPERFLPVRYFIYFIAFIQITALAFFATRPQAFPYSSQSYIDTALATGVVFMFIIPWIHALVYYIFDFSLLRKAWLTLLTLAFIALALPLQTMAHAYLLTKLSLLLAPLLYFIFSVLPLVLACVGLYGWAMSARSTHTGSQRSRPPNL